jgi:hypothetical protein
MIRFHAHPAVLALVLLQVSSPSMRPHRGPPDEPEPPAQGDPWRPPEFAPHEAPARAAELLDEEEPSQAEDLDEDDEEEPSESAEADDEEQGELLDAADLGIEDEEEPFDASELPEEPEPAGPPEPSPQDPPFAPPPVEARPHLEARRTVRVFLDCTGCDQDFIRSEITFVDYVRDRADADVHVLVSTQATAVGGVEYTARFIGLGRFRGVNQVLRYAAAGTDPLHARRRGLTQRLKLGLVRYVAETPLGADLTILSNGPKRGAPAGAAAADPWNLWVFRTAVTGRTSGERASSVTSINGSLGANRTSGTWKIDAAVDGEFTRQRFEFAGGETLITTSRTGTARALVARSLGEHWATGITGDASTSTFLNYRLRTRVGTGVEYDVFPYSEATRRVLTIFYTIGLQSLAYREETIFGRLSERRPDHRLEATLALQQPWGSASVAATAAQFLTLPRNYRLSALVTLDLRLFRGLAMNVTSRVAQRRDQINLPRGTATEAEILLRQRELATDYTYELSLGLSYTFGSIFNNVVNPRLRGAGGF